MGHQILILIFLYVLISRGCLKYMYPCACQFAGENLLEKFIRLKKKYDPSCLHRLTLGRDLVIWQDLDLAFMPGLFLWLNLSINPNRFHALHACWRACLQVAVGIFLVGASKGAIAQWRGRGAEPQLRSFLMKPFVCVVALY